MLNIDMIAWGDRKEGTEIEIGTYSRFESFGQVWCAAAREICEFPFFF